MRWYLACSPGLPRAAWASAACAKKKPASWVALALAVAPWVGYPIVALCSFVPKGEQGQWFGLLLLTLFASGLGAAMRPSAPAVAEEKSD